MTKLVCDKCGSECRGIHVLSLSYKGEPRIGGMPITLDGRSRSVGTRSHEQGRRALDLCSTCADEVVNAIIPVIAAQ